MLPIHVPVMVDEVIEYLGYPPGDAQLIDATVGDGGHSAVLLQRYPALRILAIDADAHMMARARERLARFGERVRFRHGWYDDVLLDEVDRGGGPGRAWAVLMDLGISMVHLRERGLGISFTEDSRLDLRLDPSAGPDAAELIRSTPEERLAELIHLYSDERFTGRIARVLKDCVEQNPDVSAAEVADAIRREVPPQFRHGRIHPATRTFQALRIAVNNDYARLERALDAAFALLRPSGTLVVISFHSGEDRIVKRAFRRLARECGHLLLTPKPVTPGDVELAENPASRSALLRAIRRNGAAA